MKWRTGMWVLVSNCISCPPSPFNHPNGGINRLVLLLALKCDCISEASRKTIPYLITQFKMWQFLPILNSIRHQRTHTTFRYCPERNRKREEEEEKQQQLLLRCFLNSNIANAQGTTTQVCKNPTCWQLPTKDDGFCPRGLHTVSQRIKSQVEIDEGCLNAHFGHPKPEAHKFRTTLHKYCNDITEVKTLLIKKVGHSVGIFIQTPECPFIISGLIDQGQFIRMSSDHILEYLGNIAFGFPVMVQFIFDLYKYWQPPERRKKNLSYYTSKMQCCSKSNTVIRELSYSNPHLSKGREVTYITSIYRQHTLCQAQS